MNLDEKYDRGRQQHHVTVDVAHNLLGDFLRGRLIDSLEPLSGGFLNTNYKVVVGDSQNVLRVSNRSRGALAVEVATLKNLGKDIPAPRVVYYDDQASNEIQHPFVLLSYAPGKPLYLAESEFADSDVRRIGSELGQILAKIHQRTFSSSGELGVDFQIQGEFDDFSQAIEYETNRCLNNANLERRLSLKELSFFRSIVVSPASLNQFWQLSTAPDTL